MKTRRPAFPPLPRPARRDGEMPEDHRQRCVDYYAATHSARSLAELLVDLEWREGHEPATE